MNRIREEKMKLIKWVTLCAAVMSMSCVGLAPVYDTAITHPGFTVGAGIGIQEYEQESSSGVIHIHDGLRGVRPDVVASWNLNNWFAMTGRAGVIIGKDIPQGEPAQEPSFGLGLKFSTPWKIFNLALRAEADYPRLFSLTPMMGFSTRKGHEIVTVGIQTAFGIAPTGGFISLHPLRGSHLFAAFGPDEFCFGLGYTYTFGKKGKEDIEATE
jgi:hypothetical protein